MSQLQTLSLHFLSTRRQKYSGSPPQSGKRVVLSALTCLRYRGLSNYLDNVVARISAPRLEDIDITFDRQHTIRASELGRFINRIEMQKSHNRAEILSSERVISISFTQPQAPTRLKLQVPCEVLDSQLLDMALICNSLSAFLLGVEHLRIGTTQPSSGRDHNRTGWLYLISHFIGTKWVHISGDHSTNVVYALSLRMREEVVLPVLHKICIREPKPHCVPLQEAVVSLTHSRSLAGQIIAVEYERVWISELHRTGPCSQQVMIEMLPDDVLLNIFLQFLYTSPQFWPTLAHVCRRWRQIVFTSPLGLDLRLFCTYGTPVLKTLGCWPALPVVIQYGGSPTLESPSPEDEDNIVAALKHSDRVGSISLTITSSLHAKFSDVKHLFRN
ncbi:hypothetical protein EDB87DRAFT_536188 [Lactarius vividus]|nr:hypothetical protein EDB87DRAFT_536188 [Lactarius vividus]